MRKVVNGRQILFTLAVIVMAVGLLITVLQQRNALEETVDYLQGANLTILLLLIPTIWVMYYAAGKIWHPYLKRFDLSAGLLGRIQYELNFVNTVVPFLSISGLFYAMERLKKLRVPKYHAGGMYAYRYIVSISTNWLGIAGAMLLLVLMGKTQDMPIWVVFVVSAMVVVITLGFVIGLIVFRCKVRVRNDKIQATLDQMYEVLDLVVSDKKAMAASFAWGMFYSIMEDIPFLVVAAAMGHPELFLQMVVAAGMGITIGVLIPTPMGIGGFDGVMILFMGSMGTNIALAAAIVVATRTLVLVGTAITGIPFWVDGMRAIGKTEET